jgi:signal transduction histidine kinase
MLHEPEQTSRFWSRYLPLGGTYVLALSILGGTILYAAYDLRSNSRQQITGQHASILYALWKSQKFSDESEMALNINENLSDQLPAFLETARLPQIAPLGTRLFDAKGKCRFVDPPNVQESALEPSALAQLRQLNPVARLRESVDLSEVSLLVAEGAPIPSALLEVSIPLHSAEGKMIAVAQFLLDGREVADEFKKLDRNLVRQALLTFLAGGGLLGVVLGLGFHQLQRVNRILGERTRSLLKANQELALAAKTSAVGAVTAHLIHGLKNPLSGLQNFVASRTSGSETGADADWEMAVSSTRRMQTMISEIVRVLRDEEADSQYEMSLEEFAQMLRSKVQVLARDAGVEFKTDVSAEGILRNREANLISLILYNLIHNAIQATPRGKKVTLSFRSFQDKISCEVRDEGSGMADLRQKELFKPCRSSKEGGSGIGLAISKQLANCIGADLELRESNSDGSLFVLIFSAALASAEAPLLAAKRAG